MEFVFGGDPQRVIWLAVDPAPEGRLIPFLLGGTEFLVHYRSKLPEEARPFFQLHRHLNEQLEKAGPLLVSAETGEAKELIERYLRQHHCDLPARWYGIRAIAVAEMAAQYGH